MTHRQLTAMAAVTAAALFSGPRAVQAQDGDVPRTAWGAPDLQGVWDFRSITPMERPEDLADREFLTDEEAAQLEQQTVSRNQELLDRPAARAEVTESVDQGVDGAPGFYNNFWLDRGTTTVATNRTSLIVDPPDGRMPPLTAEADARFAAERAAREGVDPHFPTPGGWMEDLGSNGLQLRCITGFNSGPPMTPGGYNNNVQIFQTPNTVALLAEMNHNVRIVPLDGSDHAGLPMWTGDARGHWEGDTLVVVTTGFSARDELRAGPEQREPAPDGALHPDLRGHPHLRGHHRRSDGVVATVDLRGPDAAQRPTGLRVRLPRGELRDVQHPGRGPGRGGRGGERPAVGFTALTEVSRRRATAPSVRGRRPLRSQRWALPAWV